MFRDPQVNVYVRDVETVVRFYADLMGFRETFRTPTTGRPVHVELRLGGLVLGFADIEATRTMHGVVAGTGTPRSEIAVWTDDTDEAFARMVAAGAPSLSAPHDFLDRLRAAWIEDPEGNRIQIVAPRTGRTPKEPATGRPGALASASG